MKTWYTMLHQLCGNIWHINKKDHTQLTTDILCIQDNTIYTSIYLYTNIYH